jgi:hypothetical protein
MTKKVFKAIFLIFLTLCLVIIGIFQYKAEKNINKQKSKYGILGQRSRISYLPFAFFLLTDKKKEWSAFILPFEEKGLNEFRAGAFYDSYIVHCFYTINEIINNYETPLVQELRKLGFDEGTRDNHLNFGGNVVKSPIPPLQRIKDNEMGRNYYKKQRKERK